MDETTTDTHTPVVADPAATGPEPAGPGDVTAPGLADETVATMPPGSEDRKDEAACPLVAAPITHEDTVVPVADRRRRRKARRPRGDRAPAEAYGAVPTPALRHQIHSMIEANDTQCERYDQLVDELVRRPPSYPSMIQAICDRWERRAKRRWDLGPKARTLDAEETCHASEAPDSSAEPATWPVASLAEVPTLPVPSPT